MESSQRRCIVFVARDEDKSDVEGNWKNEWNTWEKKYRKTTISIDGKEYSLIRIESDNGLIIVLKRGEYVPNNKDWDSCIPWVGNSDRGCLDEFKKNLEKVLKYIVDNNSCSKIRIAIHGIGGWADTLKDIQIQVQEIEVYDYSSTKKEFREGIEKLWEGI